jgi:hypothetical protein
MKNPPASDGPPKSQKAAGEKYLSVTCRPTRFLKPSRSPNIVLFDFVVGQSSRWALLQADHKALVYRLILSGEVLLTVGIDQIVR